MRTIHTEIGIMAPATRVWDVLIATEHWPAWNPFARLSGRVAPGERISVTLTPPGMRAMTMRPSIVRLEPGRELRWLGALGVPGLFDGEHGFRVVAEDVGRCRSSSSRRSPGCWSRPSCGSRGLPRGRASRP